MCDSDTAVPLMSFYKLTSLGCVLAQCEIRPVSLAVPLSKYQIPPTDDAGNPYFSSTQARRAAVSRKHSVSFSSST